MIKPRLSQVNVRRESLKQINATNVVYEVCDVCHGDPSKVKNCTKCDEVGRVCITTPME